MRCHRKPPGAQRPFGPADDSRVAEGEARSPWSDLSYKFAQADAEPSLWLADAVAGAVSAAECGNTYCADMLGALLVRTYIEP